MIIFLNGEFVPEERAVISVLDRGFLYGDGLFETLRIYEGRPFRWGQHWQRLQRGAKFLKIELPFASEALLAFAQQLIARNEMPDSLLRITVSRGIGLRGYSPKGASRPSCVMTLHPVQPIDSPVPAVWKLVTSNLRLPSGEPLAQFKTCNKLAQVLARAEADAAGADEALLLNTEGHVVEAASGNLFWIQDGTVHTPPLASGILPGVTRAVVLELCADLGLRCCEGPINPQQLLRVEGIFISLSSSGVVECVALDGHPVPQNKLTRELSVGYWEKLRAEAVRPKIRIVK